ncbi:DNA-binding transcriptional regulator, CsgD family [Erythrobacter sp. HL-111]|nr:MAG: DNA-binding HTH domain-containing protein [Erythrobacteraceae bacterium HL-111]SDR82379.1 DNA-binding transcriptional regulator, CsgD family [Erythrobacter sp. HL-111]
METTHPTSRLTEREKEALRLWLDHRTAKEIALDLGISHHAVEKRLKMARTKLGAASSLEAARMLADAEGPAAGCGQAVADPPDLRSAPGPRKSWQHRTALAGGIAMFVASIVVIAVWSSAPATGPLEIELEPGSERVFALLDEDGSGFLEGAESPFVTGVLGEPDSQPDRQEAGERELVPGDDPDAERIAAFYREADTDGDGRVSRREFDLWHEASLAEMGIEVRRVLKIERKPES